MMYRGRQKSWFVQETEISLTRVYDRIFVIKHFSKMKTHNIFERVQWFQGEKN